MGDAGDYWRGRDAYRKKQRAKMVECVCGRLEFPGSECFGCGRILEKYESQGEPREPSPTNPHEPRAAGEE